MTMSLKIITILVVFTLLLSGCAPAISRETAEEELVSFMLDYFIQEEIGGTADYVLTSDPPWVGIPPGAGIIIWLPPIEDCQYKLNCVNHDEPIQVWLYSENTLAEVANKKETIEEYKQTYIHHSSDHPIWGYYVFGIISITDDHQEAILYMDVSCGLLCGHGGFYKAKRDNSGKWEIEGLGIQWIS